jgi:hypothetical protein
VPRKQSIRREIPSVLRSELMEVVAERMFKNITEQREWNANVARQISIKPRVKVKRKGITTGRSLSQQLIERTNSHGRCYTTQVKSAEDQPRSGVWK